MSQIKLICPKCNAVEFKGKLTSDVVVAFEMDENGNVSQQITEQNDGDVKLTTCHGCNAKMKIESLVQGMQSDVSGKWYPMEQLCQTEIEDENGTRTIVLTQEEYEGLNAPSVDEMSEDQLREHAKSQDATIASMQEQMAQMMAKMEQMMAQQQASTQVPVQHVAPVQKATPAPATQAPVETNIQMPTESDPSEGIVYADEDGGAGFTYEEQGEEALGGQDISSIPGFEAPF